MKKTAKWGSGLNSKPLAALLTVLLLALAIPGAAFSQTTVASATDAASATDTASAANPTTASATASATVASAAEPAPPPTPPKPAPASDGPPTAFPATLVNDEFPRWLRFSGEYRIRPESHTAYGFVAGANDGFVLSRLRLNIEVRPTTWFSTFLQAQDSEAGGIQPAHVTTSIKDVFDLRQAYLQFRSGENSWFRLRIGRQEFRYGQERLIGASDWTNAPRVFDAVRLTLGPEKAHVDISLPRWSSIAPRALTRIRADSPSTAPTALSLIWCPKPPSSLMCCGKRCQS